MANPFSGLENIGQSYLAGLQLANQRQYREEAAAQRAEDTRVRQQYYTQMGADREAALRERIKARLDAASGQFGQDLILNPEGEPDYAGSALKRDQRLKAQNLSSAYGSRAGEFNITEPLAAEITESPEFKTAFNQGLARKLQRESTTENALARRGLVKVPTQLPGIVEDQITGRPTMFGILEGQQDMSQYPQTTIGGSRYAYVGPSPRSAALKGPKIIIEEGPEGRKRKFEGTPEEARAYEASLLAKPDKEPGINDDIDAALKKLRTLGARDAGEVNVYRTKTGDIDVRPDTFGFGDESTGLSVADAITRLENERLRRAEALGGTPATGKPKNRAEAAAQQVKRFTLEQAMGTLPRRPAPLGAPVIQPGIPTTNSPAAPSGPIQLSPEDLDLILNQLDSENPVEL
jgi:hypothetical protein